MAGITLITPAYVNAINRTLVSPVGSLVVKPNELFSALARPTMHVAATNQSVTVSFLQLLWFMA
ncbi:hypothetical protein FRB91_006576 [Serendipita sp. 411]|nr:hypothetical protein FRB91_006576 [Serendipita sp. 411]